MSRIAAGVTLATDLTKEDMQQVLPLEKKNINKELTIEETINQINDNLNREIEKFISEYKSFDKDPTDADGKLDVDAYLKKLTPKKMRKEYQRNLPKGHKSLVKKYNLEEEETELFDFRVLCTVVDRNSSMVSKRNDEIMKTVRIAAPSSKQAIQMAKSYYKKRGYSVKNAEVIMNEISDDLATTYLDKSNKQSAELIQTPKPYSDSVKNVYKRRNHGQQLLRNRDTRLGKLDEGYEDRVAQVANSIGNRTFDSKEQLLRSILNTALGLEIPDVRTIKSSGTNKFEPGTKARNDFVSDVLKALKGKVKISRKPSRNTKPKIDIQKIAYVIQDAAGNAFPDGDPLDIIIPKLIKMGISRDQITTQLLDRATKKLGGYKSYDDMLANMWDEQKAQQDFDNANYDKSIPGTMTRPYSMNLGDRNPWKGSIREDEIDEGYKIGDMVCVTNHKATPKYKIVGKTKTHYQLQFKGDQIQSLPKDRIARVNKQAWAYRNKKKDEETNNIVEAKKTNNALKMAKSIGKVLKPITKKTKSNNNQSK